MSIIYEKFTRNICTIFINIPAKRNALNHNAIIELRNAFARFDQDESARVAILGGIGGNFCAGYDLNEVIDMETAMPRIHQIEKMLLPIGTNLSEKKITIAAIEGHAAGFGLELALRCDFRVCDKDSRLGFMNRRFSFPIMNGGTVILPRLIGLARAKELVATGKAQLASEALQHGLVNYLADIGCAVGRSLNLARCLAKFNQQALLSDLRSMTSQDHSREMELMRRERANSINYLSQCEPLEVARKFLNGQIGRHGNFDMGNLMEPNPTVTL